jgi:hypothetical protein
MNPLSIVPIQPCWTQQGSSALVIKAPARLNVARDMGVKTLALRCYPINYGAFHSLCVIGTGIISAFLNLDRVMEIQKI